LGSLAELARNHTVSMVTSTAQTIFPVGFHKSLHQTNYVDLSGVQHCRSLVMIYVVDGPVSYVRAYVRANVTALTHISNWSLALWCVGTHSFRGCLRSSSPLPHWLALRRKP
jgi:hypothetical protein